MAQLALLMVVVITPFVAFWAWMFSDMTRNSRLARASRTSWLFAFVALNVFGALLYYLYEYRPQ